MVQGMTGFGSAEKGGFRVEARSLNHRFLDITIKAPPFLFGHEVALRETIRQRFGRGKFDVYISANGVGEARLDIDSEKAREIHQTLGALKDDLSLEGSIDMGMMLQWKESFITEKVSFDEEDLYGAFDEALDGLSRMREKEGRELSAELEERAARLDDLNSEVISLLPGIMEAGREKFMERLKTHLAGVECDDSRLLQEASSSVERSDVSEEVTRIKNHVEHLRKTLSEGGKVGRKLDFIFQELNREVNTLASKAIDYRALKNVIEMKAEVERSREQAQNLQ
jgi:uncharacterized protein (TIGR00255 family)